jgi:hypothetical protein
MSERPARPESEHEGYEWVVVPRPNWRPVTGRRCRQLVSRPGTTGRHGCGEPAVAELNRGVYRSGSRRDQWWAYCPEHLGEYGNWIEDGQVMCWNLRKTGDPQ